MPRKSDSIGDWQLPGVRVAASNDGYNPRSNGMSMQRLFDRQQVDVMPP